MAKAKLSDYRLHAWLDLRPNPGPQEIFVQADDPEVFYGGAKGGGKSYGILLKAARIARLYRAHASVLIVRYTYAELKELIELSKRLYTSLGATYNQDLGWRFEGGGRIRFGYLAPRAKGADPHQGNQPTHVFVDEAGNVPRWEMVANLFKEARSAHGVPVQLIVTGNPGGPGEQWLYDRYLSEAVESVRGGVRVMVTTDSESGAQRMFIPARLSDNPPLIKSDPLYEDRLRSFLSATPHLLRALLDGEFGAVAEGEIVKGSMFQPFPPGWVAVRSRWYWDTAYETRETSSYSAGVCIGQASDGSIGVLHVVRGKKEIDDLMRMIVEAYVDHRVEILVEPKATGKSIVQMLRKRRIPAREAQVPHSDKAARLSVAVAACGGKCYIDFTQPWADDFVRELTTQPANPVKDQADAWAMGVYNMLQSEPLPMVKPRLRKDEERLLWDAL